MDRIQKRFDELQAAIDAIDRSNVEKVIYNFNTKVMSIDTVLAMKWRASVSSLLHRVFGKAGDTHRQYQAELAKEDGNYTLARMFPRLKAIFLSAKEQYEGGYLFDVRNLIHADVFADELEQAKHFLDKGHKVPAAVIAGTVLESTLREICTQHTNLAPSDNINRMNDDLAGESVINGMQKKQITAWAAIRNGAAHGRPDEFEFGDVARMIDGIRDFVATVMS